MTHRRNSHVWLKKLALHNSKLNFYSSCMTMKWTSHCRLLFNLFQQHTTASDSRVYFFKERNYPNELASCRVWKTLKTQQKNVYEKKDYQIAATAKKSVAVSTLTQTCDALRTQMKIIKKRTQHWPENYTKRGDVSMVDNKSEQIRVRERVYNNVKKYIFSEQGVEHWSSQCWPASQRSSPFSLQYFLSLLSHSYNVARKRKIKRKGVVAMLSALYCFLMKFYGL